MGNNKEKPTYFSIIPAEVRYDKTLTYFERVLYSEITCLTNVKGYCWASNRYFADLYEMTEGNISKSITRLKNKGYLLTKTKRNKETSLNERTIKLAIGIPPPTEKKLELVKKAQFELVEKDELNNNNIKTNNKNKKTFSKMSTDNSAKAEIIDNLFDMNEAPENKIITRWNKFEEFTTHSKRTTKTYHQLSTDINNILQGTFEKEIDKNWLKDNKLKNIFKQPISEKELRKLIGTYSLQFTSEYQPEDKNKLTKSFVKFIYNPMSKKSPLLYLANYGLKKVGVLSPEVVRKRIAPEISKIVDDLLRMRKPNISDPHRLQVYVHVESALKLYKELRPLSTSPYIKNKLTFFKAWVAYINTYNEVNTSTFATTGYVWDKFIQHMEKEHNVTLDPKQKVVGVKATMTVIDKELEIDEEVDLTSQLYP